MTKGRRITPRHGEVQPSRLTIEAVRDATRLATYYAYTGTVLGFGVLVSDPTAIAFRKEYVDAMELFVLGHEYAHCVLEDASDRYRGVLSLELQVELELECDRIGTAIVSEIGATDSWASFCGAGAILMIYGAELCAIARTMIGAQAPPQACSHPPYRQRIDVVRMQVISTTPADQQPAVTAYLDDLDAMCRDLVDAVSEVLDSLRVDER